MSAGATTFRSGNSSSGSVHDSERPTSRSTSRGVRPAASEVGRLLAGNRLAHELMDWQPRFSLDEALDETIAWVRDNLASFRIGSYTT